MKKALLVLTVVAILFAGCADKKSGADVDEEETFSSGEDGSVIEIRERMFITQINDVYLNKDEYLGKTIKLEGLFKYMEGDEREYCFVIRNAPGCCGFDGSAGFEIAWEAPGQASSDNQKEYPKIDDWVEAQGVLKGYEEEGMSYLYIALSDLKVMDTRGAEFVSR